MNSSINKKSLDIVHLASFSGNIGDIANHKSFRIWFQKINSDKIIKWHDIEIRHFFRKKTYFSDYHYSLVQNADLFVIGGGNFLELWPSNTYSGTSLPFDGRKLMSLDTPVFVNAIGVDDGQGVGKDAENLFPDFVNNLINKNNVFFSVRNDGSNKVIKRHLNPANFERLHYLPDHVFFTEIDSSVIKSEFTIVGINLAIDMPHLRFENFASDEMKYLKEFSKLVVNFLNDFPNTIIKFLPHMYSDLLAYSHVLENLPDEIKRERIIIGNYNTIKGSDSYLDLYHDIDVLIATRFHSHILGLAKKIPVLSLNNYSQISKLIYELNNNGFKLESLNKILDYQKIKSWYENVTLIDYSLNNYEILLKNLNEQRNLVANNLQNWVEENTI